MKISLSSKSIKIIIVAVGILCVAGAWSVQDQWWPGLQSWVERTANGNRGSGSKEAKTETDEDHAGHDHGAETTSLELSAQARKNINLQLGKIVLQNYQRTITVPALVTERPGKTDLHVATPMTGVVTHVMAVKGEVVVPGKLLFEIRLTHEDLVQAQTNFLKTLGELDVENREITRLTSLSEGLIARKTILQREYEKDRLEALLRAQREALLLHGLSPEQVDNISKGRKLLRKLQIYAPASHDDPGEIRLTNQPIQQAAYESAEETLKNDPSAIPLLVQELSVHKGQAVNAGDPLCVLADLSELYIEGLAFERDADALVEAANQGWKITAIRETKGGKEEIIPNLKVIYLDNEIDLQSRAMKFYVGLPNKVVRDVRDEEDRRFMSWKYKPGQRLQLRIPVELWTDQIVLPLAAVAKEGADYFVFMQNGKKFVQRPVHVRYRDQSQVVIDNDGSLFPGDVIALSGAHDIQMAIKNKAGGGADPHAHHGHSH